MAEGGYSHTTQVECGFCLQTDADLENPKRLPCSHVHCMGCLMDAYDVNSIVQCPTCSEVCEIPVESLPTEANDLLTTCDTCTRKSLKSEPAVVYCKTCCKKYCAKHQQYHDEILDDHPKISIEEYIAKARKLEVRMCDEHGDQPYSTGCRACLTICCVKCLYELGPCISGASHQLISIDELISELLKIFDGLKIYLLNKEGVLSTLLKKTSKAISDHELSTEEMINHLHRTRDEQIKVITSQYAALAALLLDQRTQAQAKMKEFMEQSLDAELSKLSKQRLRIEARMKRDHNVDVISRYKETEDEVNRLISLALPKLQLADVALTSKGESRNVELKIVSARNLLIEIQTTDGKFPKGQTHYRMPAQVAGQRSNNAFSAPDSGDPSAGSKTKRLTQAALSSFTPEAQKTLLVTDLMDVDNQTLYYWIKSLTDIWPTSIQFSTDEERAIVKISGSSVLDSKKLRGLVSEENFYIHGEKLTIAEVASTTQIQVICSSTKSAAQSQAIDQDKIEAYFSNPKYTGIRDFNSLLKIKQASPLGDLPVFIVTYSTAQDVDSVTQPQRKPHKQSHWRFDVAEYYSDVGLCDKNSLVLYQPMRVDETDVEMALKTPSLFIKDIAEQDFKNLKLYMEAQRHTGGGPIASCEFMPQERGLVKIVFVDPKVTERVYYKYYLHTGLEFKGKLLNIELELPWLTDQHDKYRVRVSGLTEELDPEKLKFYLSALSNNVMTQMSFNKQQTRAVADFSQQLDYGKLLYLYHKTSLSDCPTLKIEQEPVADQLIAIGKLSKDDIELPLEIFLRAECNRDVDVVAEAFEGVTDMWKITTEPEVLQFIIGEKRRIRGCKTISIYSEFLGLHATSGSQRKSQELSSFVADPLMLRYLQDPAQPGHRKLRTFLEKQGISLALDGMVTVNLTADKMGNRLVLKNWRTLKQSTEKFVDSNFVVHRTKDLTPQLYNKVKPEFLKLFTGQQVITKVAEGNQINIAGGKSTVENLRTKLQEMIAKFEVEIQEEKTTRQEILPNILDFQMEYLRRCDFFNTVKRKHKLKSVTENPEQQAIVFVGLPANIEAAQKDTLALLPALTKSKVSDQKKPIFLKIFKNNLAEKSIRQALLAAGRLQAVWTLENRTLSVYSESKSTAEKALAIINTVIWEAQYPSDRELDDLESRLLISGLWKDKTKDMRRIYEPLEILQLGDKPGLSLAGLSHHKASVLEEIPYFFSENVRHAV